MDKMQFGKLWELMGTFWPNSPRYQDRKANVAYWYALQPYRYEDARAAVVRHSRKQGSFWPDVANITGTLKPVEDDAADDEPEYSWDKPVSTDETRQMIRFWARLHELPEPPVMDTAAEYVAWAKEQRETPRLGEHVIETDGYEVGRSFAIAQDDRDREEAYYAAG